MSAADGRRREEAPRLTDRDAAWNAAREPEHPFDLLIVGGGATGLGAALDGAARGHRVLLAERGDLVSGTSSASTKLIHGGLRYLRQGQLGLVREGLLERGRLLANAPHLVHVLEFLVPCRNTFEWALTAFGAALYDGLAGRNRLGGTRPVGRRTAQQLAPGWAAERFRGAVVLRDGQFDDARLGVALARTAAHFGACVLTRAAAVELLRDRAGRVLGAVLRDTETGRDFEVRARAVVNATGPWSDGLRRLERPGSAPLVAPSSGAHVVLSGDFLPGGRGLLLPKTRDGRVLFALPWHGHTLVGTTDVALAPGAEPPHEPRAAEEELEYLLATAGELLARAPGRGDVLSLWAGLRPLVAPTAGGAKSSSRLSRDFAIEVSPGGLISIAGGKWTSYRRMAEVLLDRVEREAGLERRPTRTRDLALVGAPGSVSSEAAPGCASGDPRGSERPFVTALAAAGEGALAPDCDLTPADVRFAARHEFARTGLDVLSRRSRLLLLDARRTAELAGPVAALLAEELGRDAAWARADAAATAEAARAHLPAAT